METNEESVGVFLMHLYYKFECVLIVGNTQVRVTMKCVNATGRTAQLVDTGDWQKTEETARTSWKGKHYS